MQSGNGWTELQCLRPLISTNQRPLLVVTTYAIRTNGLGVSFKSLSTGKRTIRIFLVLMWTLVVTLNISNITQLLILCMFLLWTKMQFQHRDMDLATQINYWFMRIRIPTLGPQLGLGSIGLQQCSGSRTFWCGSGQLKNKFFLLINF